MPRPRVGALPRSTRCGHSGIAMERPLVDSLRASPRSGGLPKFVFPIKARRIVESKSFKLVNLNSSQSNGVSGSRRGASHSPWNPT